jgi:hypothetical protein
MFFRPPVSGFMTATVNCTAMAVEVPRTRVLFVVTLVVIFFNSGLIAIRFGR